MATSKAKARSAQLQIQKGRERSVVTAFVPSKIRAGEAERLNKVIIEKVIKDLTGCACLSGFVDVIFQDNLSKSLLVDLESGQIG